jgi:signal transduction histidine kinase
MKRTFIRYVSHEIGTPMNIIVMGLDMLADDLNKEYLPLSLQDSIFEIRSACESSVQILNELVTLDKIEHKNLNLRKELTFAANVFHSCTAPFHEQVN